MGALAEQHCRVGSVAQPRLIAPAAPRASGQRASHRGYHRAYAICGAGARCLLQRVRVHIQYRCGRELCADYRQTYYEFFQFDRADAELVDTHDFDLMRDGWRQAVIVGLLRQHRAPHRQHPTGEPSLHVRKQFVLVPGTVLDAQPREVRANAHFGLLAHGPDGPSRTTLRIARGDGSWHTIDTLPACPAGYPVAGTGSATSQRGFRAFEHFHFAFANLAGSFHDRGAYVAHTLRAPHPVETYA